ETDLAVVAADHDLPGDVEAEAGSLADILGGEERLEHTGADLVGHAGAGVADLHHDAVFAEGRGSHRELAVTLHGIGRVVDEVRPDLVELPGECGDLRETALV